MHIAYDHEADALYVQFREAEGRVVSKRLDRRRIVDRDDVGDVGVELLFVSEGLDLAGLPRSEEIAEALRAIPRPA